MRKSALMTVLIAGSAGLISHASASSLVIDRGLPDANLNNAAGGDRSNVAWGFNGDYLSGDDFTLGSTGDPSRPSWRIDKLSLWVVAGSADPAATLGDTFSSISLFLGPDNGSIDQAKTATLTGNSTNNADVSVSKVAYPGTSLDYQGSGGGFLNIFQVDFTNLGTFSPGELLFSLGGDPQDGANPFLHASNAALSGTQQDGADGMYRWFAGNGLDSSVTIGGMFDSDGNGWDKSSDINVQIYATAIPLPTGAGLAAFGLGLAAIRRRR